MDKKLQQQIDYVFEEAKSRIIKFVEQYIEEKEKPFVMHPHMKDELGENIKKGIEKTVSEWIFADKPIRKCPECGAEGDLCKKCGMTYGRRGWRQLGVQIDIQFNKVIFIPRCKCPIPQLDLNAICEDDGSLWCGVVEHAIRVFEESDRKNI